MLWIASLAYGIGCMVDIITGLVIDFVVLSMYCHGCACASAQYGGTHTAHFLQWKANHSEECLCVSIYTPDAF